MEVDTTTQLLVVLLLMFFGAFAAGSLPYILNLRESRLRGVSGFGGGLLMGTVLSIVIPEGFHAFGEVG